MENNKGNIMISIENLCKKYGDKKALSDVNFTVRKGEIMGFLGPNGAGKSTTMNIITGYISATSGKILLDGEDIMEKGGSNIRKKIGYLPENPPLYYDMTVSEYLDFVYDLKKVKGDKASHLAEIMELVKITDVSGRMIKNLSKGYKQRVGLAQALVGDPEVLILDEPTVGLDPNQIVEIRNVIKEIGKSRTIILSTHILQEVNAVCDRVTIINKGKIIVSDTSANIQKQMGNLNTYNLRIISDRETTQSILADVENIKTCTFLGQKEDGTVDFSVEAMQGADIRRELFEAFAQRKVPLIKFESAELSLEEIFIMLTTANTQIEEAEDDEEKRNLWDKVFARFKKTHKETEAVNNEGSDD